MTPNNHLSGQRCRRCGLEDLHGGLETFVEKAQKVYGDQFDYSESVYKGCGGFKSPESLFMNSSLPVGCPKPEVLNRGIYELEHLMSACDE